MDFEAHALANFGAFIKAVTESAKGAEQLFPPLRSSLAMVERYTRSVRFEDSLKLYSAIVG